MPNSRRRADFCDTFEKFRLEARGRKRYNFLDGNLHDRKPPRLAKFVSLALELKPSPVLLCWFDVGTCIVCIFPSGKSHNQRR